MLAGLMKGPSRYSPLSNKERAGRRALIVLNEMVEAKVITKEQRDEALRQPITISKTLASAHAQYFIDWIDTIVRQEVGKFDEDLIVETTLDLPIQSDAERAVSAILARDVKKKVEQAALVSVDGKGRVRALVGGANYADSEFNRATNAHRQTGSAFKPFVFLTAMEAGYAPSSAVIDEPYSIGDWTPENYTKKYLGLINLETALANSVNTVAARIANDVGRSNVARVVRRMGVKAPINTDPAMALGTSEFTPLEMAQAYTPFSNGGLFAEAHGITRIRTAHTGKVLYQYVVGDENGQRARVIDNPPLMYMNQMMRSVIDHGTGTGVKLTGYDLAGKTGTTSDYRDAWFAGYTGGFVTVVWVGRDDNSQMVKVTGGGSPAAIWKTYMQSALKRIKVTPIPDGPTATVPEGPAKSFVEGYDESMAANSVEAPLDPQTAETPKPNLHPYVPPTVTMEPASGIAEKPKGDKTLDDVFADAEKKR
jgi:penicillin-binding protein 1A